MLRYLKKILLIIQFLILFLFNKQIHAHNYFHCQIKTEIKLVDYESLRNEWLSEQPEIEKIKYLVKNKDDISKTLKSSHGIDISCIFEKPSYNEYNYDYNDKDKKNFFHFKSPPEGLLGVYVKSRKNPFKEQYPDDKGNQCTLEELLKYKIAIEKIFVFWDESKETNDNMLSNNNNIHVVPNNEDIYR
ncbi:hypothetical protein [Candidatus Phytoplasma pini]|uniref:Uncharacterized protein n=1 Tax=Candidatus Phytoplasma pini TaxID=267362 RepID=A0A559KJG3_9MOLU|nr:hypothetical protein [Candidatus Phytoplasma pini]TVY12271.1 hypothetical protein MDPP_00218 [Candidatus Phytoplasma pini]